MSRLTLLAFLIVLLSLNLIIPDVSGNDSKTDKPDLRKHFWEGLEPFAVVAEKHVANKPSLNMPQWRLQRTRTIDRLNELREKLDTVCFYGSCGKLFRTGMNILSLLSSLFETVAGFIGFLFPLPVRSFSGNTCSSALFAREASNGLEEILSQKYQNEIQAVLKEDKALTKSLDKWLQSLPHLEAEFQKIFGFNLNYNVSRKFLWFLNFFKWLTSTKSFELALKYMKNSEYSSLLEESIGNELQQFSKHVLDSPDFQNKIQKSLFIIKFLISAIDYSKSLNKDWNLLNKKMINAILFLKNKLGIKIPFVESSVFTRLKVFDLANEVISLIDETKIIMGGKCTYSISLEHLTDMLQQELNIIESSFSL